MIERQHIRDILPEDFAPLLARAGEILDSLGTGQRRPTFSTWLQTTANAGNVQTVRIAQDCDLIAFIIGEATDNVSLTHNVTAPAAGSSGVYTGCLWYPTLIANATPMIVPCCFSMKQNDLINLTTYTALAKFAYLLFAT